MGFFCVCTGEYDLNIALDTVCKFAYLHSNSITNAMGLCGGLSEVERSGMLFFSFSIVGLVLHNHSIATVLRLEQHVLPEA